MYLLPEDVFADVLGRLPPQSLAACRCVSKEWRDFVNGRDTLRLSLLPVKVAGMFLLLSATLGFAFFARPTVGPAIPGRLEFLPNRSHLLHRISSHCNGILAFPGAVANPATRQWTPLPPPPPCPEISSELFWEHLVFDPTVSRHYEVFLIPVVPTVSHADAVFITETSEWPPSRFSLRVFSSKTWQWDERTFLREGKSAGIVADLRLLQEDTIYEGSGKMHQSVYWDGALYVSCAGNFFIRISMSGGKYQVIKPPVNIQVSEYPVLHLGRSKNEVCCALIHDKCRLQTWFLKESAGQMEWVSRHQVDFGTELAQREYGNQIHGPWMLYDDDINCQVQHKFVHESERSCDSVYDGENKGQYNEDENNSHYEPGEDFGTISDHEDDGENKGQYNEDENNCHYESGEDSGTISDYEEDEYCEVPLQFEWDSDNDNIIDSKDVVNMCSDDITFLGFHPSKEIVFLHVSSTRGVAYHFNGAKVQDLGELLFSDLDYAKQSFVYTPCRMTLP